MEKEKLEKAPLDRSGYPTLSSPSLGLHRARFESRASLAWPQPLSADISFLVNKVEVTGLELNASSVEK